MGGTHISTNIATTKFPALWLLTLIALLPNVLCQSITEEAISPSSEPLEVSSVKTPEEESCGTMEFADSNFTIELFKSSEFIEGKFVGQDIGTRQPIKYSVADRFQCYIQVCMIHPDSKTKVGIWFCEWIYGRKLEQQRMYSIYRHLASLRCICPKKNLNLFSTMTCEHHESSVVWEGNMCAVLFERANCRLGSKPPRMVQLGIPWELGVLNGKTLPKSVVVRPGCYVKEVVMPTREEVYIGSSNITLDARLRYSCHCSHHVITLVDETTKDKLQRIQSWGPTNVSANVNSSSTNVLVDSMKPTLRPLSKAITYEPSNQFSSCISVQPKSIMFASGIIFLSASFGRIY